MVCARTREVNINGETAAIAKVKQNLNIPKFLP
jgi:hypothetical protein